MTRRATVVVLGSFLEREYCDLWQRQQEFTGLLCRTANVLYVERAAAGRITPRRLLGRLRKLVSRAPALEAKPGVPLPAFVHWRQEPVGGTAAFRRSAHNAWRAVERAIEDRGWEQPSLVCMGTPGEVWAEFLRATGLPFWYDIWERLTESPAYRHVPESDLKWLATNAALVTTDTPVSRDDWVGVRPDIVVVPHGAKEWAEAPDLGLARDALYYVGSANPANLDAGLLSAIGRASRMPVRMIGTDPHASISSVEVLGWHESGAIPRVMSDAVAGLIPYWVNDFTAGTYPTKVYDYLLAGAPVLSSALPALDGIPGVTICDGAEEFVAAAEGLRGMGAKERKELRAWALENGWSRRFATVSGELQRRGVAPEVWA